MPLSEPAAREKLHTRTVTCEGFRRADGLWDIEGHMTDVKSYGFDNSWRGRVEPGEPLHGMWLRITIDDDYTIRAAEAFTEYSPYEVCGAIAPNFKALEGLTIGPGFTRKVKELLGGTRGCTHLVELLGPMATTAYQTLVGQRRKKPEAPAQDAPPRKPWHIDTCHALASDGPIVKKDWPDFYTGR
ncbi:DUF2889 domain-containing protein [Oceanibaculum indicum]|uniref:DUF2889 domain-containing protein n=2 Tax=Oceanibaculum indicum TaxID=526216 RepID=K2KHY1_9PROT|nr:DUF2889 domain-containing protein [Oceanibaculum indicum]EKE76900.1 hypothetical protein P24_06846 [Oceanibaculum indicum P24]RKQ68326.1 Protein of unknown function (DUF2889) [Oceanibaculum indicum]